MFSPTLQFPWQSMKFLFESHCKLQDGLGLQGVKPNWMLAAALEKNFSFILILVVWYGFLLTPFSLSTTELV